MLDSLSLPASAAVPAAKSLEHAKAAQTDFLVVGIVGAVGAGTSWTAKILHRLLARRRAGAEIVTARAGLAAASGARWAEAEALDRTDPLAAARAFQAIGDDLRLRHDHAFVATAMTARIASLRRGAEPPAVAICDSLRHPAEARLLRMVYGDAFWLLGTVCDSGARRARLTKKFTRDGKGGWMGGEGDRRGFGGPILFRQRGRFWWRFGLMGGQSALKGVGWRRCERTGADPNSCPASTVTGCVASTMTIQRRGRGLWFGTTSWLQSRARAA